MNKVTYTGEKITTIINKNGDVVSRDVDQSSTLDIDCPFLGIHKHYEGKDADIMADRLSLGVKLSLGLFAGMCVYGLYKLIR